MAEIDLGKVVGATGETGPKGETGEVGPQGPPGPEGIVDGNSTINFTVPEVYQEPQSGDSIANLFGRFKRWILDIVEKIGDLTSLKTPDKKSTVAAINANYDSITQLEQDIGNPADLTTDAKEVVGAVNELNSDLTEQSLKIATLGSGSSGAFSGDANELRTEGICIYRTTDNTVNCAANSVLITAFTVGGAAGMQAQHDSSYNFKTRRYWHGTWSPWK